MGCCCELLRGKGRQQETWYLPVTQGHAILPVQVVCAPRLICWVDLWMVVGAFMVMCQPPCCAVLCAVQLAVLQAHQERRQVVEQADYDYPADDDDDHDGDQGHQAEGMGAGGAEAGGRGGRGGGCGELEEEGMGMELGSGDEKDAAAGEVASVGGQARPGQGAAGQVGR